MVVGVRRWRIFPSRYQASTPLTDRTKGKEGGVVVVNLSFSLPAVSINFEYKRGGRGSSSFSSSIKLATMLKWNHIYQVWLPTYYIHLSTPICIWWKKIKRKILFQHFWGPLNIKHGTKITNHYKYKISMWVSWCWKQHETWKLIRALLLKVKTIRNPRSAAILASHHVLPSGNKM
jgi:hypothetical protein